MTCLLTSHFIQARLIILLQSNIANLRLFTLGRNWTIRFVTWQPARCQNRGISHWFRLFQIGFSFHVFLWFGAIVWSLRLLQASSWFTYWQSFTTIWVVLKIFACNILIRTANVEVISLNLSLVVAVKRQVVVSTQVICAIVVICVT